MAGLSARPFCWSVASSRLAGGASFRHTAERACREAMTMQRVLSLLFAAGLAAGLGGVALAQEVDIQKAVHCETLAQQFGDSIKAAKADDATKTTATDLAKQGAQACNGHDYDGGMDQLRQALQQVGLKPVR
jgi:hypothetical protein